MMKMDAMQIRALGPVTAERELLALESVDVPEPAEGEVLIRVIACGVCHTELDEIEGRTPPPSLPVKPGHEVVFVYDARFTDHSVYARDELPLNEDVWDGAARWIDLDALPADPIYPEGLLELLGQAGAGADAETELGREAPG